MRVPALVAAVACLVAVPSLSAAQPSPVAPRTEQEWIVASIVERIHRAVRADQPMAAPPRLLVATVAASPAVFTVTVGDAAPLAVRITGHLWAPSSYVEVVRQALGARRASAAGRSADATAGRLLETLLGPSSATRLLDEDRRISAEVRRAPLGAAGHEQAALLLAAMALREGAAAFTDERPALSRLTAHLAVAAVLRGEARPGQGAAVADAALLALVGREGDAVAAAARLDVDPIPAPVRAWARAVQLRATGDWRRLAWPTRATPLERTEYGRALVHRVGDHRLMAWLDETDEPPSLSWSRLALQDSFSVESGQTYAASSVAFELDEAVRAWTEHRPGAAEPAMMSDLAAAAPDEAFRVLDWPLWAGSAERHLVARAFAAFRHERDMLGRRQRADEIRTALVATLTGLRLFPVLQALIADQEADRTAALGAAAALLRAEPHQLPPAIWHALAVANRRQAVRMPSADAWFTPWTPDGTILRPIERALRPRVDTTPVPTIERLHAQAPSETWVAWTLAWRLANGAPTVADARRQFGGVLDYDVRPHRWMLSDLQPSAAESVALATATCEIDVDSCSQLAGLHLRDGRDAEAAVEYERWFWRSANRVRAAGDVLWLVRYLFDTGQAERAAKVAAAAGAVGSNSGLQAQAEAFERQGRDADAEAVLLGLAERYDNHAPLGAYYLRRARRSGDAADRVRGVGLLRTALPRGLEPPPLEGPPPADGVTFTTFGERAARAGLQKDDVIVGMHGYRVRSTQQTWTFTRLTFDDAVTFVVWRDGRYQTVHGRLGQQTLGADLRNYAPPAATP